MKLIHNLNSYVEIINKSNIEIKFNKDIKMFVINNNIIDKKLDNNNIEIIVKYINKNIKKFDTTVIDYDQLVKACEVVGKINSYSPIKEKEKEEKELQKAKEKEEKELQKAKEKEEKELQKAKEKEEKEQDKIKKEQEKLEKELQKAKEKEEKELQKAKEKEEKELQRAKEKEEKELQRTKEKEEKELQRAKEKEEKELQKAKEKEEKELQKAKEKEEKELQKAKEKEEKELQKAKEKEEKENELELLKNIIINEYKKNLAVDSKHNIRLNGKIVTSRMMDFMVEKLIESKSIVTELPLINKSDIKRTISNVASNNEYHAKIGEEETFDDVHKKIIKSINNNEEGGWLSYINDGTDKIMLLSLYLLFSDTYGGYIYTDNKYTYNGYIHYNKYNEQFYVGYDFPSYRLINDGDAAQIIVNASIKFGKSFTTQNLLSALSNIKDYVEYVNLDTRLDYIISKYYKEGVTNEYGWDGTKRLNELFVRWFECEDNEMNRLIPEIMLMLSLRENYAERDIDHKIDYAFILFGGQGSGKSEFLLKLFFNSYYSPNNLKDTMQLSYSLSDKLLCFWDELKGWDLSKTNIEDIKDWITCQQITWVQKFKTFESHFHKTWIDIGATNEKTWFNDNDYERRFIVVDIPDKAAFRMDKDEHWWDDFNEYYIEQVWLEALTVYKEKYVHLENILFPQWSRKYNEKNQIARNKIMDDQEAVTKVMNLVDYYVFNQNEYENKDVDKFKREYLINRDPSPFVDTDITMGYNKLNKITDSMIYAILNNRKQGKVKLLMKYYFGWDEHNYVDKYGKSRWYFTRPDDKTTKKDNENQS